MMAAVAGASNAALLAIVNGAATNGRPHLVGVALFMVILYAYAYAQRYVLLTTSEEVERIVHHYREKLLDRLGRCELREIERIGRGQVFSAIVADTRTISQTASALVLGAQAVILIACASVYLAMISLTALVVIATMMTSTALIYLARMRKVGVLFHKADGEKERMLDLLGGLLDGFKEAKLSSARIAALLADFVAVSQEASVRRCVAEQSSGKSLMLVQSGFFLQLGALVFVTPLLGEAYSSSVAASITTVIFFFGPLFGLVASVPQLTTANNAAENLYRLEQTLKASSRQRGDGDASGDAAAAGAADDAPTFETLELERVFFSYLADGSRFDVGPIDLRIEAGQTVFITGGNGSGKSTLIKLLTGLYPPLSGELRVNDVPVSAGSAQAYRDRFCAVFSDFHLFRKFYGIAAPDAEVAQGWLEAMELADKTALRADGFSTIDLSAGQRKRLALISAMLEDKPVVVLDEWAADQDPHFRRKFYEELLPRMKAAGKTVIAVTHDDRYFHHADRRLHMDEGQLRELSPG